MKTFKNTVAAYCGVTLVLLLGFAVLCGCTGMAEDEDNKPVQQEIGVVDNSDEEDNLDEETEWQIRQDYWYGYRRPIHGSSSTTQTINDVWISYYGTYNGYVAVIMGPPLISHIPAVVELRRLEVAGTYFTLIMPHVVILVWKPGENTEREYYKPRDTPMTVNERTRDAHNAGLLPFYELRDAYDLGMVTADDVKRMADRFLEGRSPEYLKDHERHAGGLLPRYPTIFTPEELSK